MIVKTSELEGAALDWAVAKAIGETNHIESRWYDDENGAAKMAVWCSRQFSYDWAQGGPLIEEYGVKLDPPRFEGSSFLAGISEAGSGWSERFEMIGGSTALIAAMRAIVAAELGETVDVPEELVK